MHALDRITDPGRSRIGTGARKAGARIGAPKSGTAPKTICARSRRTIVDGRD